MPRFSYPMTPTQKRLPRQFYRSGHARDFHGVSIRAQRLAKTYQSVGLLMMIDDDDDDMDEELSMLLFLVSDQLTLQRTRPIPRILKPYFHLGLIPEVCGTQLRFRYRDDVIRVYNLLRFPSDTIVLPNKGGKFRTEQLFYCFLIRMGPNQTMLQIIQDPFIGGETSKWGKGIRWMAKYIHQHHAHRLNSFKPEEVARFPMYAASIQAKSEANHAVFPPNNTFEIMCFVDGNNTKTCAPGTGPVGPGTNQPRADATGLIQKSAYTGHTKSHGYKILDLSAPDGRTIFLTNMASARRNDNYLLIHSDVENLLGQAQNGNQVQYAMYGDSIFPKRQYIRSRYHVGANHPFKQQLDAQDRAMNKCRISVEWTFGEGDKFWPYSKDRLKTKLKNPGVYETYFCRALLRNCYLCCYEGNASKYFSCPCPSLETYMGWP